MVKNKVKSIMEKYMYNILLTLIIFILFAVAGYSKSYTNYQVYVNDSKINLKHGICEVNGEHYIHIEDLTSVFNEYVLDDKISGKLIITTYDNLVKIGKNDDAYIMKKNGETYIKLNEMMKVIGNHVIISKNKIYVSNTQYANGIVQKNRTELYDIQDSNVLCFLNKQAKLKIHVDENIQDNTGTMLNVETIVDGKVYYGKVLKKNVVYDYENSQQIETKPKIILVKADKKIETSTDTKNVDFVAINMYRLSGVNTLTKLEHVNNSPKTVKVLATVNNGHKSSNYDASIVTGMLNSESNRYEVIKQILNGVQDIAGVNLDFSNFKLSDKANYTQFVKELAAVMHKNEKILLVNVPSTQYIDIGEIAKYTDYIVVQPYGERTVSSKTSGPISSIAHVTSTIQDAIDKVDDVNKIILELPAHTILWTERRGTVINAEQYNMKTMQLYLKENNITAKLDKASGQNYVDYIKGITTYRMWLEDEYSILKKTELANKYNLAGVSIYRSGMELKGIYKSIFTLLNQ